MRLLLSALLLLLAQALFAQTTTPTPPLIQYPVKGYVVLNNDQRVVIRGLSYLTTDSVLLYQPGTNQVNGAYTFRDDIRAMPTLPVAITSVKMLKAKRQSFLKGALTGGIIGFGVGYLLGYLSYEEDFGLTDEETRDERAARGFTRGLMGSVPAGLAGGFAEGIFMKKRFPIRGRQEKLRATLDKLYP